PVSPRLSVHRRLPFLCRAWSSLPPCCLGGAWKGRHYSEDSVGLSGGFQAPRSAASIWAAPWGTVIFAQDESKGRTYRVSCYAPPPVARWSGIETIAGPRDRLENPIGLIDLMRWILLPERCNVVGTSFREEDAMLSRCANPDCGIPFNHGHGRFFRFRQNSPHPASAPNSHSVQHHWLCDSCSKTYTLD